MFMTERKPTHPGYILLNDHVEPSGLTITAWARHLRISRKRLSEVLNEKARITPDLALRLSCALGTSAELWTGLQTRLDLWLAARAARDYTQIPRIPDQPKGEGRAAQ